jgi:hypothetical protein
LRCVIQPALHPACNPRQLNITPTNIQTQKNSKKSNVPFVSTLYTPIGKSVRLVKNVAGTGASLALTIPSKVLKSARKNTQKIAKKASKSAKRVSRNFMSSLGNMFKKTMKNFTN